MLGEVSRKTAETSIRVRVAFQQPVGASQIRTPLPFLTHMLEQLAKHGGLTLEIEAEGDTHIDGHHTTEDLALTLGQALSKALGDRRGIQRYGWATLPMDEACVSCALDLSGRPFYVGSLDLPKAKIGDFDVELVDVFFDGFARGAGANVHLHKLAGDNLHHIVEIAFKAFSRSLRHALSADPYSPGVPSTKGQLQE